MDELFPPPPSTAARGVPNNRAGHDGRSQPQRQESSGADPFSINQFIEQSLRSSSSGGDSSQAPGKGASRVNLKRSLGDDPDLVPLGRCSNSVSTANVSRRFKAAPAVLPSAERLKVLPPGLKKEKEMDALKEQLRKAGKKSLGIPNPTVPKDHKALNNLKRALGKPDANQQTPAKKIKKVEAATVGLADWQKTAEETDYKPATTHGAAAAPAPKRKKPTVAEGGSRLSALLGGPAGGGLKAQVSKLSAKRKDAIVKAKQQPTPNKFVGTFSKPKPKPKPKATLEEGQGPERVPHIGGGATDRRAMITSRLQSALKEKESESSSETDGDDSDGDDGHDTVADEHLFKDPECEECREIVRAAHTRCSVCEENFCDECWTLIHSRGTRVKHEQEPLPSNSVVTDVATCRKAVRLFAKKKILAVDCEGVSLSRVGRLCLVQVSDGHVTVLFDVVDGGMELFTDGGLKELLENDQVVKVFHDVRGDSDALYHQANVKLENVVDTQIAYAILSRQNGKLTPLPVGLNKVLKTYGTSLNQYKDEMKNVMEENPEVWQQRPMSKSMIEYSKQDVSLLAEAYLHMIKPLTDHSRALMEKRSMEYVAQYRDQPEMVSREKSVPSYGIESFDFEAQLCLRSKPK